MNKNLIYFLLAITFIASCRKDDDNVFDKSPDERLNETLKNYQAAITGSPYGWNANMITGDGGSYRFYFSFNDSNRVQMYSDFDSTTATVIKESSYRLKALQQPSLIFDTYSYLHILSDPDAGVNGGTYGQGLKGDFEFRIDTVTADSISLTGRFNGSKLSLRKAAQADRSIWANKQVTNGVVNFKNYWKFLLYFRRLTYSGTQYELQFDTTVKKVTVSWTSGANTQSVTRGYYFWANGVYFSDPVVNGSATVPGFSITSFNAGSQIMNVTVNGTAATITGFSTPINPDVRNASNRWWQQGAASDFYWISFDGFHVNGVDDAYNIKSIKNDTAKFYFLLYKPNTNGVDAFFTIYRDTLDNSLDVESGSWVSMNVTSSSGRARFSEVQERSPWPAGAATTTRNQMFNGSGYYIVQSSSFSYDMVSIADAKVWITWFWLF
ncbi:DUF4302 domain-containing protein [Niastella caeni]|uniref:DUF4302 domain-containing protein n=1 Tax=Niastella caeni TaxID=2569763 RepID=A0A4S8HW30_9BACT|nr:DUF4302 domain-containing protein [Niastella caeni]THU39918.1 DUF4302 domain-containing protein [Niastella caeni]